jgi:hypothetical protein
VKARQTLQSAIRDGEAMPDGQRSTGRIAGLKKRLSTLGGAATAAQN